MAATSRDARAPVARRVMLYSHDTFGLGHLRRSRAIAQGLAAAAPDLAALILTGSPIAGRFDFADRVDHVRLPGVVKLPDGDYASHNLGLPLDETVRLRAAIIRAADQAFGPDLLIVDKEAWGFRNELAETLEAASRRGARIVLGVRDVLDEPAALAAEWARKGHAEAIERYFDEIWVYGLPQICRPLEGLGLSERVRARIRYTGYLRRDAPEWPPEVGVTAPDEPFVLVMTGGGGDGEMLVDWALSAYEADPTLRPHAVIVYGPFLAPDLRAAFDRRAAALGGRVTAISFDPRVERLQGEAQGIVAMGGYNTFCEILSRDKPAVIVPRVRPRKEQLIRAQAAARLGLARMLVPDAEGRRDPAVMAAAIRGLADQPRPSAAAPAGMLDGLDAIIRLAIPQTGAASGAAAPRGAATDRAAGPAPAPAPDLAPDRADVAACDQAPAAPPAAPHAAAPPAAARRAAGGG
ncbi:Predicted glycosyl transferase [Oceanicella actignis]|uniref:Predicted glycosyl transferase n=2 Tax=Oceanicella actignis TaxID=1189325 RepID=A0A1M7TNK9_9RHOB|nr:Predicted glycosyl transferase [Oceanicella actignis]SHN72256.1 Predicted glycosyl transferase [Oceanicella actignis]